MHDGYRRLGVTVSRTVWQFDEGGWLVEDQALPTQGKSPTRLSVGWNLPEDSWEWAAGVLRLGAGTWVGWDEEGDVRAGLVRAGTWVAGEPVEGPVALWGWTSPRYSAIEPCLRLVVEARGTLPLRLRTRISPDGEWSAGLLKAWGGTGHASGSMRSRETA
jgi:hypothetical protein